MRLLGSYFAPRLFDDLDVTFWTGPDDYSLAERSRRLAEHVHASDALPTRDAGEVTA